MVELIIHMKYDSPFDSETFRTTQRRKADVTSLASFGTGGPNGAANATFQLPPTVAGAVASVKNSQSSFLGSQVSFHSMWAPTAYRKHD